MNHPQVLVTEFAPIVSWEVALACQEAGWLRRYVTSVYFKPSQFPYSIVKDMPRSLRERCLQQLANRDHPEIDKRLVHSMPFVELGHRFLSSQPFVRKRVDWLDLTIAKNVLFDEYVSRFCFEEHDILYAFGSCSLQQLRHARRVESASILESTHVHPTYHGNVLREESRFLGLPNREIGPRWEWWLKRQLEELELADYVATLSNFSRQTHLLNGADPERVFVLEPGVSLTDFYPVRDREATPPGPDRPFRILFVGTISARKGVYYLLEAFKQLKLPNAELLLRGGVDDGMGEILARYDGLFRILPPVPRADLHAYFNDADLFVLPSLLESFGLVIFQAMACGTPVIATTACGATFDDGHEGYVIEPRDVEALKERILRLYDDATLRLRMGQHAAARARHQTWQSFRASTVAMMETVYRERALR